MRIVPEPIKSAIMEIPYILRDTVDLLSGRRGPLIPPTRLMFDGPRDVATFKENGEEFLRYYIELCGLKPYEKVLDVGCGIGRKTIPLTTYLDETSRYEGFDVNRVGIDWCRKKISTRYPNFRFQHADVFNKRYNPEGKHRASEYRFPFEDAFFDFVVLGSVFTHMLPADMENYFSEIARVLKEREGRCLISFFLLNEEALELIEAQKSTLDFRYDMGRYRVVDADVPEQAVCYEESLVLDYYDRYGLRINRPIHYGSWCGRRDYLSYQDLIIAQKT